MLCDTPIRRSLNVRPARRIRVLGTSKRRLALAVCAATLAVVNAWTLPSAFAQGTVVVGKFKDWTLHVNEGKSHKICFVTSEPTAEQPSTTNRAPALFYVSSWPKDGIKSEVSIKVGYKLKPSEDVVVTVESSTFKLFPYEERAFVADATQELKLVEAMKKGAKLQVKAAGERGQSTLDTYSLNGVTQALKLLASNCP